MCLHERMIISAECPKAVSGLFVERGTKRNWKDKVNIISITFKSIYPHCRGWKLLKALPHGRKRFL